MRTLVFGLVFVIVLAFALVAATPLSFVLQRANIASTGLQWGQAQGTVWNGRLSGLTYGVQPIGDMRLSLRPSALLSGRVAYDLDWNGPAGRGSGTLEFNRDVVILENVEAEARIAELKGLADRVRALGGRVELRAETVRVRRGRCAEASGRVSTDALANAAAAFGRAFAVVEGPIECDGPMLQIPLQGRSSAGDELVARLRVGVVEPSTFEAEARTEDSDFGVALSLLGFEFSEGLYKYRRETSLGGAMR
ncbi:MAG: type II secretion system protein N [Pseudomonadota bacterium]